MGDTLGKNTYCPDNCFRKFNRIKMKNMKKIIPGILLAAYSVTASRAQKPAIKSDKNRNTMIQEQQRYVHFHGAPSKGKILMVASSPAISKQTNWPIGFWAAELTHPLRVFQEAGYEVELASTDGGKIEMDGYSNPTDPSGYSAHDVISLGYMQQKSFNDMLAGTRRLADIQSSDYAAVFLVGGQGPMYTFRGNKELGKLFASFYEAGKPSAAVCHSTCLLLEATKSDGELLIKGKTWTGFADAEEEFADKAVGMKIQPYRIEEEARKISGTNFKVAAPFSSYAIQDGNLITGQQQNSGAAAAELVVQMLEKN
jgi:putative intracellular protease/amidase